MAGALYLKSVALLDITSGEVKEDVSISIDNGKIDGVGKSVRPHGKAEIVDASGKLALPGLIDCHVHFSLEGETDLADALIHEHFSKRVLRVIPQVNKYLPAGFTTVADLASPGYVGVALRDLINQGVLNGPRILAAGNLLSISGGHSQFLPPWVDVQDAFGEIVDGRDKVREAVRRQLAQGVDIIKFCATGGISDPVSSPAQQEFSDEEMRVIVEEAKRAGKMTATHAEGLAGIKAAVKAGVDAIEHGWELDDECLGLMKEKGIFLVPTFSVAHWIFAKGTAKNISQLTVKKLKEATAKHKRSFARALRAGVNIAMGTDAGSPFNLHGNNAFEMVLMVRNGMSELEAIRAATKSASENLRISKEVGTIEEGKSADIILVEGNPLKDISLLCRKDAIKMVIKNGAIEVGR